MGLGTFTPPASGAAGSFDPRNHPNKPLIVVVREFRANFTTRKYPTPKDVLIVDIVDILADTVHVSVIWGAAAIVDRLKGSAAAPGEEPQRLPVKITHTTSATGNPYTTVDPLDGKALELAAAWDQRYPTRIDDERAARAAETQNAAARYDQGDQTGAAQAPQFQGFTPQQAAPQQGFTPQQAAPQGFAQPQQAPAASFNAPAPQQAAPQGFAQPQQAAPQQTPAQQMAAAPSSGMSDAELEAAIASLG